MPSRLTRADGDFEFPHAASRKHISQDNPADAPGGDAQDSFSRVVQVHDPLPAVQHQHAFAHLLDYGSAGYRHEVKHLESEQRQRAGRRAVTPAIDEQRPHKHRRQRGQMYGVYA